MFQESGPALMRIGSTGAPGLTNRGEQLAKRKTGSDSVMFHERWPGTSFSHEDTAPGLTTLGEHSPGIACINISPGP